MYCHQELIEREIVTEELYGIVVWPYMVSQGEKGISNTVRTIIQTQEGSE